MTSHRRNSDLIGGSPRVHARAAGLVGLLVLASGSFAGFVASRLFVRDDVVATTSNIVASESFYRLGIASSLVMMVAWLFASPGYLVLFVQGFLLPGSERTLWSSPFLLITHFSELALLLWLLIKGVNVPQWERRALESIAP